MFEKPPPPPPPPFVARTWILFGKARTHKRETITNDINKTCAFKIISRTAFIVYILLFAIKLASIVFWSALFSFIFFSFHVRLQIGSDRKKSTMGKFHIAKLSFVIGDHLIHWMVCHSRSLRACVFFRTHLISHIFELPVGFYWHRSSICVQNWLSLHHTFSLFGNNVSQPSSSLSLPMSKPQPSTPKPPLHFHTLCCVCVRLYLSVVHRSKKRTTFQINTDFSRVNITKCCSPL